MVLQPSEERRRSGSHYTPRALTEPIVRTTLEPILARLRGEDGRPPRPDQILDLKVCDPAMGSGAFLVEACRQLGDALVEAWHAHGEVPAIPPDEDEVIFARRLIAQRCLYGVDRNPVAVDLAKMSLWLVTLAKDHALTFVDHALRHGDSLVGLSRKQIAAFHWNPAAQMSLIEERVRKSIDKASDYRKQILSARDDVPYSLLKQKLDLAEEALSLPRQVGDAVVAAFFVAEKAKDRENARLALSDRLIKDLKGQNFIQLDGKMDAAIATLKTGAMGVQPFHWEIEFPEVFVRPNPGFDAIAGNPPFLGGAKIWPVLGGAYCDYIRTIHANSGGKAVDLVAHFFRRAFDLLRNDGCLGLIATNTISQGDTRAAGLQFICIHGGTIFAATKRLPWPGQAAVLASSVHIRKGPYAGELFLDGRVVERITAFLFHAGSSEDPARLRVNWGRSFRGNVLLGMGFTFDDSDNNGVTTPLAEMETLIQRNELNRQVIQSYIGGAEINESPTQSHHRYVINFRTMTETEARRWPDLMEIVEQRVKPERDKLGGYSVAEGRRNRWWQFGTYTPALDRAISNLSRCLVLSRISARHALSFQPVDRVFADSLIVFPMDSYSAFTILQSRPHEIWARFFGSSLEDRLRYTPSDCFETFPFPEQWEGHPVLDFAGKAYYEFRAGVMVPNNEGLTKTYNRFHDPDEIDPKILKLRELHSDMDRAVFDAYGWADIPTTCEFLLDYDIDEEERGNKKKPWRYRWPDEVRDEVLARLLDLNAKRAKEEEISGAAAAKKAGKTAPSKRVPKKSGMEDLFS